MNRSLRARGRQRTHGAHHEVLKQQIAARTLLTPVVREIGDLAPGIAGRALEGAVERAGAAGLGSDGARGQRSQRRGEGAWGESAQQRARRVCEGRHLGV